MHNKNTIITNLKECIEEVNHGPVTGHNGHCGEFNDLFTETNMEECVLSMLDDLMMNIKCPVLNCTEILKSEGVLDIILEYKEELFHQGLEDCYYNDDKEIMWNNLMNDIVLYIEAT